MTTKPRIALLPLARSTFDVAFAEQNLAAVLDTLSALDAEFVGPRELLFDAEAAADALQSLQNEHLDLLLLLQVTFTDATMTVAAASEIQAPIAIWAPPEPRTGERLRLNALCGLNLAVHALGKRDLPYDTIFAAADDVLIVERVAAILRQPTRLQELGSQVKRIPGSDYRAADAVLQKLNGQHIARIGQHPDGFDTCAYDADFLQQKLGVQVDPIELDEVFTRAKALPQQRVDDLHQDTAKKLAKLDEMEPEALGKSLRVYGALADLAAQQGYPAMAVRCWPEMFTDYGCAACGAMARLNQDGIPAGCEADVDGTLTAFILKELAGSPALITDMVDVDSEDNSAVLWHCGLAPLDMADPDQQPEATLHSNRQKPLLNQFAFKPGMVTVARLSKAKNQPKLVVAKAEMVRAPRPFGGTAGVLRFEQPVSEVLDQILHESLEHHYVFVYGDVREDLYALADRLDLPVLQLGVTA